MTDKHKQLTLSDLDLPRPRGRPKTGKALTNAEKQAAYRLRNKGRTVRLTFTEMNTVISALYFFAEHGKSSHTYADLARLMSRFGNAAGLLQSAGTDQPLTVQPASPATDL